VEERLATKRDLKELEERLVVRMQSLEERLSNQAQALEARMQSLEERLSRQAQALEERLNSRMQELEYRMTIRLGSMMVVAVGLVASLVKLRMTAAGELGIMTTSLHRHFTL
jgi:uncharacterized coiled-coil protein SlyX